MIVTRVQPEPHVVTINLTETEVRDIETRLGQLTHTESGDSLFALYCRLGEVMR